MTSRSRSLSADGRELLALARAEALTATVEAWISGKRWEAEAHLDNARSFDLALRAEPVE